MLESYRTAEEILEGETSCFLSWGDARIPKRYDRVCEAERLLAAAETSLQ